MLQSMRKSAGSTVVKVFLFGLLILSFVAWGISGWLSPKGDSAVVATVGDKTITAPELSRAYSREIERLNLTNLQPEQAKALGLADRVLDNIIIRTAFDQEVKDLNIAVSDETVASTIRAEPYFKDNLGQFDRARYEQVLQLNGMTEAQYVAALKGDLGRSQLINALTGAVATPSKLADKLYRYREESREADVVAVTIDPGLDVGTPDEDALKKYYDEHKEEFRAPEYRALTFIKLAPQDLTSRVNVSDDEIKAAYDDRASEFTQPEKRHILQMLLPSEEKAKEAEKLIADGASFAEAAKKVANVDEKSLDLGTLAQAEIPDDAVAKVAFALKDGEVSSPTEGLFGWFLVKVEGIQAGSVKPLEEVKDKVRQDVALSKATDLTYELSNKVDDAIAGGANLEEVAKQLDLKLGTVDAVDVQGKTPDGKPAEGLPASIQFLKTAFSTDEGADSLLTETEDNGYFMVRVDKIIASKIPELGEIKNKVVAGWQDMKRAEAADNKAEVIADRMKAGESADTVAATDGVEALATAPFTRDGQSDGDSLPAPLVADLFKADVGGTAVARDGDRYVVGRLKVIHPADPKSDETQFKATKEELKRAFAQGLLLEMQEALKDRHDVTIHHDNVDQVYR